MTVPQLRERLPLMREWFPTPMVQEWSLAEYLDGMKKQERRTLAGLDAWRKMNLETVSNFDDFDDLIL